MPRSGERATGAADFARSRTTHCMPRCSIASAAMSRRPLDRAFHAVVPKLTRNTMHAPQYYPPNSPVADCAAGAVNGGGGLERLRREMLDADGVEAAVTSCARSAPRAGRRPR